MSMTSATTNTDRLKFIYNIILKYMSRRDEAYYHQLLQLNANLLALVRGYKEKRNQYVKTLSNPNRPHNSATANYANARNKLLARARTQVEINRLIKAEKTYVTQPKVINQPNGSKSLGY